jgi:hypothetical protein
VISHAVFERMNFIAQFELRALIEELLAAPNDAAREEATAAMRVWLRCHCISCGTLIAHDLRRRDPPEQYCFVCFPPPPPDLVGPAEPPTRWRPDDGEAPF